MGWRGLVTDANSTVMVSPELMAATVVRLTLSILESAMQIDAVSVAVFVVIVQEGLLGILISFGNVIHNALPLPTA